MIQLVSATFLITLGLYTVAHEPDRAIVALGWAITLIGTATLTAWLTAATGGSL